MDYCKGVTAVGKAEGLPQVQECELGPAVQIPKEREGIWSVEWRLSVGLVMQISSALLGQNPDFWSKAPADCRGFNGMIA